MGLVKALKLRPSCCPVQLLQVRDRPSALDCMGWATLLCSFKWRTGRWRLPQSHSQLRNARSQLCKPQLPPMLRQRRVLHQPHRRCSREPLPQVFQLGTLPWGYGTLHMLRHLQRQRCLCQLSKTSLSSTTSLCGRTPPNTFSPQCCQADTLCNIRSKSWSFPISCRRHPRSPFTASCHNMLSDVCHEAPTKVDELPGSWRHVACWVCKALPHMCSAAGP